MEKFLIRKSLIPQDSSFTQEKQSDYNSRPNSSKRICVDLNNLPSDPGLREKTSSYHPKDQDNIRRAYIQMGPYWLVPHDWPQTEIGGSMRWFNPDWFKENKNWLEYNIEKDMHLFMLLPI